MPQPYCGRFAPSPTGLLHAGSMVAALASWLDARAHGGRWLVRIEDVDTTRCKPEHAHSLLRQLAVCGLVPDAAPVWQSQRGQRYQRAFDVLMAAGQVYACDCSRQALHAAAAYPGTCRIHQTDLSYQRQALSGARHAWRVRVDGAHISWVDRRLGQQSQFLPEQLGDFIVRRRDQLWAYQLAVVLDDAEQGITHVVRGEDLADNTPRQIHLQNLLSLPRPQYLHSPLVLGPDGRKLSKQNGAPAMDKQQARPVLRAAAAVLGLNLPVDTLASTSEMLQYAVQCWKQAWVCRGSV
jgi:glutamyl-Q tRNA(Asp) synthetase